MKDLRLVIDPADIKGHKNRYINVLQHIVLKDVLGDTSDLIAADIGCGTERFRDLFNGYYGIDSNPKMQPAILAECNDLPKFMSGKIDIVLSVWMLQYQLDLLKCMSEIKRVLVPGGRLVMIEQISEEGYATVLPRSIIEYSTAFEKPPETCFPILRGGDLLVGAIRRGLVPERVFPVLARLHLMFWYLARKGEYTDYLMVFRK
jgi:SAM-dependent methyltransferase